MLVLIVVHLRVIGEKLESKVRKMMRVFRQMYRDFLEMKCV